MTQMPGLARLCAPAGQEMKKADKQSRGTETGRNLWSSTDGQETRKGVLSVVAVTESDRSSSQGPFFLNQNFLIFLCYIFQMSA